MDNLASHKVHRVRRLTEQREVNLLYLPAYSPNLIEEAFFKIKALLRKATVHGHEALVAAMGEALSAVSSRDAQSFLEHCGYANRFDRCERRCETRRGAT